jgi:hypothetical protein
MFAISIFGDEPLNDEANIFKPSVKQQIKNNVIFVK